MESYFNYNGKILSGGTPVVSPDNRGLRYGDGLFETIRWTSGQMPLAEYHFERLFSGMAALQMELPSFCTPAMLTAEIDKTCKKNKITGTARVRLAIFRGNGGLFETDAPCNYAIQVWPISGDQRSLNENGLSLGLYPGGRKSCDELAGLKSANYLIYVMAALYAKRHQFNECIVLNTHDRICDGTIANVFWIKDGVICTPPLSEGCVAGVMRRWLLLKFSESAIPFEERKIFPDELEKADELFLTNAISGIRWVKSLGDRSFSNHTTLQLFKQFLSFH